MLAALVRAIDTSRHPFFFQPPQLPEYGSWALLLRNELARDEGRRMYWYDPTGETVPVSDDEEDDRVSNEPILMAVRNQSDLEIVLSLRSWPCTGACPPLPLMSVVTFYSPPHPRSTFFRGTCLTAPASTMRSQP